MGASLLALESTDSAILKVLARYPFLTAKQIHEYLKTEIEGQINYHTAYKAIKRLSQNGQIQRSLQGYSLCSSWVESIKDFAGCLDNKELPRKTDAHAKAVLTFQQIRFIPFWLGERADTATFEKNNKHYTWFPTGICVQRSIEESKQLNVIDTLLYRREDHLKILNGTSELVKEMRRISENPKHEYVMSTFHVEPDQTIHPTIFGNLLKMLTQPNYLGIDDNPDTTLEEIDPIRYRSSRMEESDIDIPEIIDVSVCNQRRTLTSWSNVVISATPEHKTHALERLIKLETELQHLWFLMYLTILELEELKASQGLKRRLDSLRTRWIKFTATDPMGDEQYLRLKEALIETSRIKELRKQIDEIKDD